MKQNYFPKISVSKEICITNRTVEITQLEKSVNCVRQDTKVMLLKEHPVIANLIITRVPALVIHEDPPVLTAPMAAPVLAR